MFYDRGHFFLSPHLLQGASSPDGLAPWWGYGKGEEAKKKEVTTTTTTSTLLLPFIPPTSYTGGIFLTTKNNQCPDTIAYCLLHCFLYYRFHLLVNFWLHLLFHFWFYLLLYLVVHRRQYSR